MRALRDLARPAVATAAAVLLLAGCGGDDNDDSSASSTSTSSSSATSSSSPSESESGSGGGTDSDLEAFCADAQEFVTALQQVDPSAPETIPPALQEATAAFDAANPPEEIASDWETLGDVVRSFADTANSVDIASPEGAQQLQDAATEFTNAFTGPEGQNVDAFVTENCTDIA